MSDTAWERRQAQGAHSPLLIAGHWENLPLSFLRTQGSAALRRKIPTKASSGPTPFQETRVLDSDEGPQGCPIAPTHPCCYSPP